MTVYEINAILTGDACPLGRPKNFFNISVWVRENLNIRFFLAFSQSWFSNRKIYFGSSLLHIHVESDTSILRSIICLPNSSQLH